MFRLRDGSGDVTTASYSWKYMYTINDDNWVAHTSGSNVNYVEYISAGGGNANHYNGIFEFFKFDLNSKHLDLIVSKILNSELLIKI